MSKEIQKHILELFKVQQLLGSGAYGHVWKVIQKSTHKTYALKKVFDAFQNDVDAQRTYRQITILHQLNHQNIIKLKSVIKAKNQKDLYIVFEHMQTDLHSLVGQNILETPHMLYIIYQIFKALKYLHSAQIIHRDLKPSNILINSDCEIKLCDFGLVRSLTHQQDSRLILSEDVATRWYRSPQMLLGSQQYDWATDVWSVGCILAQLIIGQPILMGGSNIQQLQKILQMTGIPKKDDILSIKSPVAQSLILQFRSIKKPFKHYFKGSKYQSAADIINLIKSMLEFNPTKRITVDQVLNHQLLAQIRSKKSQMNCQKIIIPQIDDNVRLTVQQYRKEIYKDIDRRYPEHNKNQQIKVQAQFRYMRGHNSVLNRTTSINSFTRSKPTNSLLRPTRSKQLFDKKIKSKQTHQSLHCNTLHTSIFYKNSVSKINNKQNHFNSLHSSLNPFKNIPNKQINEEKQSTDVSTVAQKSPFRKYKKYQGFQNPAHKINKIQKLSQQNTGYIENNLSKQLNHLNDSSPENIKRINHKPYLYDPSSIYSHSPPKGLRQKEKNFYETMAISNNNKIVKKALNKSKKQYLYKVHHQDTLLKSSQNTSGNIIILQN